MGEILLGAAALILLVFLLRAFVGLNPALLVRSLRYVGVLALALLAVAFFFFDRPGVAIFAAGAAWSVFTGGHAWPGGWPHWSRRRAPQGQSSSVRTDWIEMELDHDSGEMRGTILKGPYAGRRLDELDRETLMAFHAEASANDAQTARLLEAWLDRTIGPDWRADQAPPEPPPGTATGMTRAEALSVLGLKDGASEEDIRAAHRRLMMQNHPDHGGSDYLASKINQAKDVLLGA